MFTGIIIELGRVLSLTKTGELSRLYVETSLGRDSSIGDSIAINGVCLTVVDRRGNSLGFDLSSETLRLTNLGLLRSGSLVNIEPAMKAGSSFGGHIVTGHVDCTGTIVKRESRGETLYFEVSAPGDFMKYLVPKGSVAVDGISLTVVDLLKDRFTLVIIPHTARVTTLGFKVAGDIVNLEADIIGKYVVRYLEAHTFKKQAPVSLAD